MIVFFLLLLFDSTFARAAKSNYIFDYRTLESLKELETWELRLLRDFVRGKGKASFERTAVESEIEDALVEKEHQNEKPDKNVQLSFDWDGKMYDINHVNQMPEQGTLRMGNKISNPSPPKSPVSFLGSLPMMRTSVISPASKMRTMEHVMKPSAFGRSPFPVGRNTLPITKINKPEKSAMRRQKPKQHSSKTVNSEPTQESFKELASLLKGFIDRRKPMLPPEEPMKTTKSAMDTQSTSAIGAWEVDADYDGRSPSGAAPQMLPKEKNNQPPGPPGITPKTTVAEPEDWEEKMKGLSQELTAILMKIKDTKDRRPVRRQYQPKTKPKVTVLREGSANQTKDGLYEFVATLTLIQDEGKNILVDTGLGTDINGRTVLLNALSKMNLAPPLIHIVVTTHGHPDHAGGVHDFPDAIHYQGWYEHQRTFFNLSGLFESDRHPLTSNVYLTKTPGHSSDDISVTVMDEEKRGNIVIVGDVFMRRDDIDYPIMWQPLSANEAQQSESRKQVICSDVDWIIPGHGSPFKVDPNMKKKFQCIIK